MGGVPAGTAAQPSTKPPESRRASNKARTRAAILEASLTCIIERGAQATTMDQIAAMANVARATLFNYFPGKTAIIQALVTESDAGFFKAIERWRAEPGLGTGARLLGLFAATALYLQHAPARKRALVALSWLNWAEQDSGARIQATRAAFTLLLEQGRASGELPPSLDLARAADVICATYMGLVNSWWIEEEEPVASRFEGAARLLARMIDPEVVLPRIAPSLQRREKNIDGSP